MSPFNHSTRDISTQSQVLITGTADNDPYSQGLVSGEEHPGPVLSLLSEGSFGRLVVLDAGNRPGRVQLLLSEVSRLHPEIRATSELLGDLGGETYNAVTARLQLAVDSLRAEEPSAILCVCLNAWPPSLHIAWMRLTLRNPGLRLLEVTTNLQASVGAPRIEVV